MRRLAALLLCVLPVAGVLAGSAGYVRLPGGSFRTALKYEDRKAGTVRIAPFALMKRPVTNAEFLAFVQRHPQWRRDRVARTLADARYLGQWKAPTVLASPSQAQQPVTQVSWFAADAYCQAEGARLPTWSEWEYAAAADETRTDARRDPA
ncbi:MAG TPA: formylglycine-generating enzyme family protein, partial [Xanthomonadaceae bacterium]|nr:formylglycine-generating enzyme family protein [Xanthomonadaceae bacterium]